MFLITAAPTACKQSDEEDTTATTVANSEMIIDNVLMQTMEMSSQKMNDVKTTGDYDLDFANNMIVHHQMAIDMSNVEIAKGTDPKIINIAKGIAAAQAIEIREMQQFVENYIKLSNGKNMANSDKITLEMKQMMGQMHTINLTNIIDKDYVSMMIPHHESAVAMANNELIYGKETILKDLSRNIIEDQNFEINEFKKWQSKN